MLRLLTPMLTLAVSALSCSRVPAQDDTAGTALPVTLAPAPIGAVTAELIVEGVDCASCNLGIQKALRGMDGVVEIRQGQSKQHVLVDFVPGRISAERIIDAVTRAGFDAEMFVHGERT